MLKTLSASCKRIIEEGKETKSKESLLDDEFEWKDAILCPYQSDIITDESPVVVYPKGRQIGASWVFSCRSVIRAISGQKNTIVNSINKDAVKNFIRDAGKWARIFNGVFELITYEKVIDNKNISIFELKFSNGFYIIGLPGTPQAFRSFSGCDVILDEIAYREQPLDDFMAAAMATLIHGGTVRLLSTHAGIDSDFNQLIEKCRDKELPYKVVEIPFKKAVAEGLYKRICKKQGIEWTQEKEDEWVAEIYAMYGTRAAEELDAIPADYSLGGKIFNNFKFGNIQNYQSWERIGSARYTDLACTEDKEELIESAFYSASVRIDLIVPWESNEYFLIITDWFAEKLGARDGDDKIEELTIKDGVETHQVIEQEPGSSGEKYVAYMEDRLGNLGYFNVNGFRPVMEKTKRALPAANAIQRGQLLIDENIKDKDEFCRTLYRFCSKKIPLVTDLGDCVAGAYLYLINEYNAFLN